MEDPRNRSWAGGEYFNFLSWVLFWVAAAADLGTLGDLTGWGLPRAPGLCSAGAGSTRVRGSGPLRARPVRGGPAPRAEEGAGAVGGDWRSARPLRGPRAVGTGSPV